MRDQSENREHKFTCEFTKIDIFINLWYWCEYCLRDRVKILLESLIHLSESRQL